MRTLDPDRDSLLELVDEIRYTLYRLRRSAPAAALLPGWEALYKDVRAAFDKEWKLVDNLLDGSAWIDCADGTLDVAVMRVVNTLVKLVGNDRSQPLYVRYLGNKSPS